MIGKRHIVVGFLFGRRSQKPVLREVHNKINKTVFTRVVREGIAHQLIKDMEISFSALLSSDSGLLQKV